ncbi:MAG: sterol desaturase family protein [Micavibrio sp.]|nr:sterol desaturase family protein [Micavibrio sp.]
MENLVSFLRENRWSIALVLVGMALAGLAIDRYKGRARHAPETWLNLSVFAIGFTLNNLVYKALQLAGMSFFGGFALAHIPLNAISFAAAFVLVDFIYYWRHRLEHIIPVLWAEHSVHHSSEEFNFSTALRLPWVTPLFGWVAFVPLVIAGFSPLEVFIAFQLNLLFQYFIHNDTVQKLGAVEKLLNTPANHRVHHASNAEYIDKNFAGVFILWDRMFGTYEEENAKPVYGAKYTIPNRDPFSVNFYPWVALLKRAGAAGGLRAFCRTLFVPLKP